MQKEWKQKISKKQFDLFLTTITKKNRTTEIWVDKETDFAGQFKRTLQS